MMASEVDRQRATIGILDSPLLASVLSVPDRTKVITRAPPCTWPGELDKTPGLFIGACRARQRRYIVALP